MTFLTYLYLFLVPLSTIVLKASLLGSTRSPVQFLFRSKKRLLLRYSPSHAPLSMKNPLAFFSRNSSTMADWPTWGPIQ